LGVSNYTLGKLLVHAMNMMTGFSTVPLRVASLVGFAFALFGFLTLAYVVGRYFFIGHTVPGFAFLASLISILAGAQLFALGIIGEYLGRMHFRLLDRPSYAVRSAEGFNRQRAAAAARSQAVKTREYLAVVLRGRCAKTAVEELARVVETEKSEIEATSVCLASMILKTAVDSQLCRQVAGLYRFSTAAQFTQWVTTAISANTCG
jgi:hypothetical protein